MFTNRLGLRPILCTIAAFAISAAAIAYAPRADQPRHIIHHKTTAVHKKKISQVSIPRAINTSENEPKVSINPMSGCRQVELTGPASSYLKLLSELLSRKGISSPRSVEMEVEKSHRLLKLIVDGELVKTYVTGLGKNPDASKISVGDKATPTGDYYVCQKNPNSRFYLALKLSYPNKTDAERGVKSGLIDTQTCRNIESAIDAHGTPPMNTRLGGNICIHGGGAGTLGSQKGVRVAMVRDWTAGCIALDNYQMKELFDFIPLGTKVRITQ